MRSDGWMERIWRVTGSIPAGRVASYGQIAQLAGHPRGARLTARALAVVPAGRDLPWHRVLRNDGTIALAAGSHAAREQVRRLRRERVAVVDGRVDMAVFRWRPDLDELLWGPVLCPGVRGTRDRSPERRR